MYTGRIPFTDGEKYAWRHMNLGRLLLNAYSFFEQGLTARFEALGYTDIRPIHLSVLRELDMDGTRVTVIAIRAGVSKQAMSLFVQECEKLGLVQRTDDPDDRRAKKVVFTEYGRKFIHDTQSVIQEIELEIIATLGVKPVEVLRDSLARLGSRLVQDDMLLVK
jgi:DNA-binding MarR family transcriptional regulator